MKAYHILSVYLLLSIPVLYAQEEVASTEENIASLDATPVEQPGEQQEAAVVAEELKQPDNEALKEASARAAELLHSYNPNLFGIASYMVTQSRVLTALINKVQKNYPRLTLGYTFTIEEGPAVHSDISFTFEHPLVTQDVPKQYTLDELDVLNGVSIFTEVECALLKEYIVSWQRQCDQRITSTIGSIPELYKHVTEHKLSLNQFINLAWTEPTPVEATPTENTEVATEITPESAEVVAPQDSAQVE